MHRGEIWWANLPNPQGSGIGYRRPVLIMQSDAFTASRLSSVIVVAITGNLRLAAAPGNVFLSAAESGLPRDSVINVSHIITLDKNALDQKVGWLAARTMRNVEQGIRLALEL
jgi:mRNA interferase MazF